MSCLCAILLLKRNTVSCPVAGEPFLSLFWAHQKAAGPAYSAELAVFAFFILYVS
jgi:hypothetical protein